jgi:hypothetical protein
MPRKGGRGRRYGRHRGRFKLHFIPVNRLLRQSQHLAATAAHGKVRQHLSAFALARRMLGEGVEQLRVWMKFVLARCLHVRN